HTFSENVGRAATFLQPRRPPRRYMERAEPLLAMAGTNELLSQPESKPASLDERLVDELPGLRAFVARLAGKTASSADVEDCAQETVARGLRYRGAFDGERALGPWLRTTALRVFLDHKKRGANAPQALEDRSLEATDSNLASAERFERREQLAAMLERLDAIE